MLKKAQQLDFYWPPPTCKPDSTRNTASAITASLRRTSRVNTPRTSTGHMHCSFWTWKRTKEQSICSFWIRKHTILTFNYFDTRNIRKLAILFLHIHYIYAHWSRVACCIYLYNLTFLLLVHIFICLSIFFSYIIHLFPYWTSTKCTVLYVTIKVGTISVSSGYRCLYYITYMLYKIPIFSESVLMIASICSCILYFIWSQI